MRRAPVKRRTAAEREASAAWKAAVGPCVICPRELVFECDGPVHGHHAVSAQALKKRGLRPFLWDLRNQVSVCERRHAIHHSRILPIPAELLPDDVWAFAVDVGLTWWLERFYPTKAAA